MSIAANKVPLGRLGKFRRSSSQTGKAVRQARPPGTAYIVECWPPGHVYGEIVVVRGVGAKDGECIVTKVGVWIAVAGNSVVAKVGSILPVPYNAKAR